MLAPAHAITSALGYLVVVNPLLQETGHTQGIPATLAGCIVAAGAGLFADLDTETSTVSRALPPVTNVIARVFGTLMGGHRNGSHSILAVIAMWFGSHWIVSNWGVWPLTALLFVVIGLAIHALFPRMRDRPRYIWTGALLAAIYLFVPGYDWLPGALAIGYAMHLVGDMLTVEGVPPLWPLPPRVGFGFFTTGKPTETIVRYGAWACACYLIAVNCILPLAREAHPELQHNAAKKVQQQQLVPRGDRSSQSNAQPQHEAANSWVPPQQEQEQLQQSK